MNNVDKFEIPYIGAIIFTITVVFICLISSELATSKIKSKSIIYGINKDI